MKIKNDAELKEAVSIVNKNLQSIQDYLGWDENPDAKIGKIMDLKNVLIEW